MRLSRIARSSVALGFGLLAGLISGCATTSPTINSESEPTADGLYKVTGIDADEAWAQPNVDMARYSKIILQTIDIEYRPGGETRLHRFAHSQRGPFEVPEHRRDDFRIFAEEELLEELGGSRRFTLVDEPSADTLHVTFRLLDLVSYVPPDSPGPREFSVAEYGEATLVMELRESMTEKSIVRVVDRRAAEAGDRSAHVYDRLDSPADPRRMFREFAQLFRQRLDEISELDAQSSARASLHDGHSFTIAGSGVE